MDQQAWEQQRDQTSERASRVAAAAREMVDSPIAPLQADWRHSLAAVLEELERIVERDAHPDDVDRARAGIAAVASMFLAVDDVEAIYLGGDKMAAVYGKKVRRHVAAG